MTEMMARALATTLGGEAERSMPASRTWGVLATLSDGRLAAIEEGGGWLYRDRRAYEAYHETGDPDAVLKASEWVEWEGGEDWARGLSLVLGSEEYWHSGGGIWLVFYRRPDGKFAVLGSESGAVYKNREEFEADDYGEKGENHPFV
jgi:hypothetical protein